MKSFSIELAKAGHPICTEHGLCAEILDFHADDSTHPMKVKLFNDYTKDYRVVYYKRDGTCSIGEAPTLYIKSLSGEMWTNIYDTKDGFITGGKTYRTEERAKENIIPGYNYVKTIKITI